MDTDYSFILLFDGHCNLCNSTVQWILLHDTHARFRFASLQSQIGQELLKAHVLEGENLDSVVFFDGKKAHIYSDAPLEISRYLPFPWNSFFIFKIVPKALRDALYSWVAKNRYRWFGQKAECMLPRPEWKNRFLG